MSIAAADAQALVGRRSEMAQFRAVARRMHRGTVRGRHPDSRRGRHRQDAADGRAAIGRRGVGHDERIRASFSISGPNADTAPSARWWRGSSAWDPGASSDLVEGAIDTALRELRLQPDDALYLRDLLEVPQPEATRGVL